LDGDAIVNPANSYLQLGAGVAEAISLNGGPSIQAECDAIGYCPEGQAVITRGGNLKARYVIHAVGPLGSDPDADTKLISATRSSLQVADENGLRSIAFPAISTGVFGYPMDRCAEIMLSTTMEYFQSIDTSLESVVFCLFGKSAFSVFKSTLTHLSDHI
jgi:O-acetyl-ADP-ribose deacetylase (regulator of RNase III)